MQSRETLENILNEVKYLRQEVEFLKKLSGRNIQQRGNLDECGMEI